MKSPSVLSVGCKSHKCFHFGSNSSRDLSIKVQPISKRFTVLDNVIQCVIFSFVSRRHFFASWPRKRGSNGPVVVALHRWLFSYYCRVSVAHTHGRPWTFSEQVIASITCDNRSGMSIVAFRTAHQLAGVLVLAGSKSVSVRPSVRTGYNDDYRSWQKLMLRWTAKTQTQRSVAQSLICSNSRHQASKPSIWLFNPLKRSIDIHQEDWHQT